MVVYFVSFISLDMSHHICRIAHPSLIQREFSSNGSDRTNSAIEPWKSGKSAGVPESASAIVPVGDTLYRCYRIRKQSIHGALRATCRCLLPFQAAAPQSRNPEKMWLYTFPGYPGWTSALISHPLRKEAGMIQAGHIISYTAH